MAKLYLTEYCEIPVGPIGRVAQVGLEPPLAEQTVSISGTAAQSSAFNVLTRFIRIATDTVCSVLVGTNPTATTSSGRMVAGMVEWRAVRPGSNMKISVIQNI